MRKSTSIREALSGLIAPFLFSVFGIQINPDGCVVAKGYDEGAAIFRVREELKASLSFFPKRQSGWAHIPLGRILEPVGEEKFSKLKFLIGEIGQKFIFEHTLTSASLFMKRVGIWKKKLSYWKLILTKCVITRILLI